MSNNFLDNNNNKLVNNEPGKPRVACCVQESGNTDSIFG